MLKGSSDLSVSQNTWPRGYPWAQNGCDWGIFTLYPLQVCKLLEIF